MPKGAPQVRALRAEKVGKTVAFALENRPSFVLEPRGVDPEVLEEPERKTGIRRARCQTAICGLAPGFFSWPEGFQTCGSNRQERRWPSTGSLVLLRCLGTLSQTAMIRGLHPRRTKPIALRRCPLRKTTVKRGSRGSRKFVSIPAILPSQSTHGSMSSTTRPSSLHSRRRSIGRATKHPDCLRFYCHTIAGQLQHAPRRSGKTYGEGSARK
jgi:hypothetical protein